MNHFHSSQRTITAARAYTPFGGFSRGFARFGAQRVDRGQLLVAGYGAALVVTTVGVAATLLWTGHSLNGPLWVIAAVAILAIVAERQPVRISPNTEITVSVLPVLFAAVVFGPLTAMLVGSLGVVADFRRPYSRWAIWTSMRALAGAAGGLAAMTVAHDGASFGLLLGSVALAAMADALVDTALGAVTVAVRGTGSFGGFLRSLRPVLMATIPLYTPVVGLLAYAYIEVSPWSVLLFFAPAFAAQSLYRLYHQEREAAELLTDANERLARANLSFARALVSALDARDRYTAGHSAAVAVYARDIAAQLGLSSDDQELAHLCGLLHDIGKVGLPPGLLEKTGPLTLAERKAMQKHAAIGERILANVEDYAAIATIVRHHHERVDGAGYPDGLAGGEIPLLSRILGVADAYNAMTSGRPYRDAMPSGVARLRLAQAAGTQFDLSVVAAFEALLASSGETYRSGARSDFAVEAQHHRALVASAASAG